MSTDLRMRQMMRKRRKKQMMRRNIFFSVLLLIIITILIISVKSIFSNSKNNTDQTPEFIFNGYVYPQPPEKDVNILSDLPTGDGIKTAYLTFDDGPNNTVTVKVLDILRRYNVKATFFMVGTLIEKNPHVARRIYDEGHLLANHSYSHNYSELYANTEEFMNQVNKTQELINNITRKNTYPKVFRFPGGGYDAGSHGEMKQKCKISLEESGYRYCDWNSLTGDAESVSPTAEYVTEKLKSTVGQKEDVVILMHDALAKSITPETLPEIIEYLMGQGYTFDTLDNV